MIEDSPRSSLAIKMTAIRLKSRGGEMTGSARPGIVLHRQKEALSLPTQGGITKGKRDRPQSVEIPVYCVRRRTCAGGYYIVSVCRERFLPQKKPPRHSPEGTLRKEKGRWDRAEKNHHMRGETFGLGGGVIVVMLSPGQKEDLSLKSSPYCPRRVLHPQITLRESAFY